MKPSLQMLLAALAVSLVSPPVGFFGYALLAGLLMAHDERGMPVEPTWLAVPVILGTITAFSAIAGYAWACTTAPVRRQHVAGSGTLVALLLAGAWFAKQVAQDHTPSALSVAQGVITLGIPAVFGMVFGRAVGTR